MKKLAAPVLILFALSICAAALLFPLAPLQGPQDLGRLVVVELRLPRLLLGLGYGAVLGLTGASLQALFANPLASPDITGASSGAALGAVVGSTFLGLASPLAMGAAGASGAALTLLLLFAVAGRRPDAATLLLAGLAISLASGAATSLALALAPSPFAFYEAFDWLMGSLVDRSLGQAAAALMPALLACAFLLRRAGALDRLALGDDVAASMGVPPSLLRREVVLASAVAVGTCVAVCGAVGFVGLIAPVIARHLTRGHPGRALLPAALIGAFILVSADLLTKMAPLGRTIPLGVITATLGTPIFLWVLLGMRGRLASMTLLHGMVALPPRLEPTKVSLAAGQRVALIGPNGSGKTTLLKALAGIEGDYASVTIAGEQLQATPPVRRAELLSYLPASRDVRWPIPVRDVIALGLVRPDPARIDLLLDRLRLTSLADRPIDRLSTGERARALLGRALASRPRLLLLDEPLSNLDPAWVLRTLDLLDEVAAGGTGIALALHDLSLVSRFDRIWMLDRGKLVADVPPGELLQSPDFWHVFEVEPDGAGWTLNPSVDRQSSP